MAVKMNFIPSYTGNVQLNFSENTAGAGIWWAEDHNRAYQALATTLTDTNITTRRLFEVRNDKNVNTSLHVKFNNVYGAIQRQGNSDAFIMNIVSQDITSEPKYISNIKDLPSGFAYGLSFGSENHNFVGQTTNESIAVGGLVISDFVKYIKKVTRYVSTDNIIMCRIYIDSNYKYADRLEKWYFQDTYTKLKYQVAGSDSTGIYVDMPMPSGGSIFVSIANFLDTDTQKSNAIGKGGSTVSEWIENNNAYERDIVTNGLRIDTTTEVISGLNVTYTENTFKVQWDNNKRDQYNLIIKNGNSKVYEQLIPQSNNEYNIVELDKYYIMSESSRNITITVEALANDTSYLDHFDGYSFTPSSPKYTFAYGFSNYKFSNGGSTSVTRTALPISSPKIEISKTGVYKDRKVDIYCNNLSLAPYITVDYTVVENNAGIVNPILSETNKPLTDGKISFDLSCYPKDYTITAVFNYRRSIGNEIITATSRSSRSFVLSILNQPTISYKRTGYNSMDVTISNYELPEKDSFTIYTTLDGIVKNTTTEYVNEFTFSIEDISVGAHNIKSYIVYKPNGAFNSNTTVLNIPASVYSIIETPRLTLYKRNSEIENEYDVSGNLFGNIYRQTNRIFQFTSVNYATDYELHIIDNAGNDSVLVPFNKMTRNNLQYFIEIPENSINTEAYQFYIKAKVPTESYNSQPTEDLKLSFEKYSLGKPIITNVSGSSILTITENPNNSKGISNLNRYIKAIVKGDGFITNFSIKINGSATLNLYDFLLNKKVPKTINVSFFEYTEYLENSINSVNSDSIDYKLIKLQPVNNITLDANAKTLSWPSVSYASSYRYSIRQNGRTLEENDTINTSATYTTELSSDYVAEYYVRALREINTENPYYINSEENGITAAVLEDFLGENITRNGSIISWTYPKEVSGFNIYKNGTFWKKVIYPTTFVDIGDLSIGEYVIGIEAFINSDDGAVVSNKYFLPKIVISKLDKPNITTIGDTSKITWQTVQNADYYEIYASNTLLNTITDSTYTVTLNEPGTYSITVKAKSNDSFIYRESDNSNEFIYNVIRLDSPSNVVLHEKDETYLKTTITWDTVKNATRYKYTLGNITETITTNYIELNDDDIKHQNELLIQAICNRTDTDNPRYLDSEISSIKFGRLPTPVIVIDGNTVRWKMHSNPDDETSELIDYSGADYFEIFDTNITDKDGNYIPIITTPYLDYILSATDEKTFNIYVRAISDSNTLLPSDISSPLVHTVYKVKLISGDLKFDLSYNTITNILSWPDLKQFVGADYFEVYINDELETSTVNASIDLTRYIKESGGYYTVYVIAKSYKVNYIPSDRSFVFNKFINVSYQYGCRVNHKFYKIINPFGLKTTASEVKDTGKIAFYSDSKEEIKAYTPISILLYTSDTSTEGEPSECHDMLVSKDKVVQIQQGNGCVYMHNISTIELTKELETKFISGLTVTQPLEAVQRLYSGLCECQIGSDTGKFYIPEMNGLNINLLSRLKWYDILIGLTLGPLTLSLLPNRFATALYDNEYIAKTSTEVDLIKGIYKVHADAIYAEDGEKLAIKGTYKYNDQIALPYAKIKKEHIVFDLSNLIIMGQALTGTLYSIITSHSESIIKVSSTTENIGKRRYYLIPHTELSQEELYNANIYSLKPVWSRVYENDNTQNFLKITKQVVPQAGLYDLIYTTDSADDSYGKFGGLLDNSTKKETNTNRSKAFRIMYRNISIEEKNTETPLFGTSMVEGIQQVLDKLEPRIIRNSDESEPEYKFNSAGIPTNLLCPEFTFNKNKSLWEILLEMGRTFNGIPRLNKNKVISFDILSQIATDDNPIQITNEKEEIESSMDNYTSSFISEVSGMSTEYSEWYPSKDGWTTARSTNPLDPTVSKKNMGLILPHNINYIEEFWVKAEGKEIDIISYVKEKTIYNALNNNKQGKGTAIYYEQGKPYVYGFGITSENDELAATLGLDGKNYAISNILSQKSVIGDSILDKLLTNINSFQYRVKYKPLINTNIITEQSNLSDMPNNVMMNFNQDASVITDSNFGKSAQVQLARIGNNDIVKTYRSQNFTDRHTLGECMIVDDKRYYADVVSIIFNNTYIETTISYSKDFNKINPRIGVSSEYRMWDIPNKNIVNRTLHINNYCYISKDKYTDIQQGDMTFENGKPKIMNEVKQNYLGKSTERKSFFYMTSLNNEYNPINPKAYGIVIPAAYAVLGPSISYSGKLMDYLSAGVMAKDSLDGLILQLSSKRIQKDIFYTEDNGELPAIKLSLCKPSMDELKDTTRSDYKFETYFPQVAYKSDDTNLTDSIFSLKYKIDKDRREALGFNYQLFFQTYDKNLNLLHKGLTSYLYYDDLSHIDISKKPAWYGFNKSVRLLESILPEEGTYIGSSVSDVEFEGLDRTLTRNETKYGFKLDSIDTNKKFKTVALIWPSTGEIILDYTYGENDDTTKTPELYFNFSDTRINAKTR